MSVPGKKHRAFLLAGRLLGLVVIVSRLRAAAHQRDRLKQVDALLGVASLAVGSAVMVRDWRKAEKRGV